MNHVYRLVWNDLQRTHVPAAECKRARGKTRGDAAPSPAAAAGAPRTLRRLSLWLALAFAPAAALALPQGEQLAAGSATVSRPDAGTLTVEQASARAVLDWQSFSIAAGERVNFIQPGRDSVALNRVLGGDPSAIHGSLDANGQVFLVNPNGILFGQNASVNVGGLVASTLDIANGDFMNGHYRFGGNGEGEVRNRGRIVAARGGAVALLGGRVINDGTIRARLGTVALAAGSAMTLDFAGDGLLNVTVDAGAVDALARNGGLIRADGGTVLMTAVAAEGLAQAVVNQQGVIEAQAVDERGGTIRLVAEGEDALVKLGGTLDASNPEGGAAGRIETRGAWVELQPGAAVKAGPGGQWELASGDFHVGADEADILAASLDGGTDVTIGVTGTDPDANHLAVESRLRWTGEATLRLQAEGDIDIEAAIRAPDGSLEIAAGGTITDTAALKVDTFTLESGAWRQRGADLPVFEARDFRLAGGSFLRVLGGRGTERRPYRIFDVYGLQGMASADLLGRHFRLANDIDASGTAQWWGGQGFLPVGNASQAFTGSFNGRGHVIDGLVIDRPGTEQVGLFGHIAQALVHNVRVESGSVRGYWQVGGLVGYSFESSVRHSHFSGSVEGVPDTVLPPDGTVRGGVAVGGLVGRSDFGTVRDGHFTGTVRGRFDVGGLVGRNRSGLVAGSSAHAQVEGESWVGGLVGINRDGARISDSHADGSVSGGSEVGGLAGYNGQASTIKRSSATAEVWGDYQAGGLVGSNIEGSTIAHSDAGGDVHGIENLGGLAGYNAGGSRIKHSQASGSVLGGVYWVGGLVGMNYSGSTIRDSHATGEVSGYETVGGLVGLNQRATIERSHASGRVSGSYEVGGLVGLNARGARVDKSHATGDVSGYQKIGGLVGSNSQASVSDSHAEGSVQGVEEVGGLVGKNLDGASIVRSWAEGAVRGDIAGSWRGESWYLGGLVGWNTGESSIEDSHASGNVSDGSAVMGGLVGRNGEGASIVRSHASGSVSGIDNIGGLAGANEAGGIILDSHASGNVSGKELVGGLVGSLAYEARIEDSSASGEVRGEVALGGLVGQAIESSVIAGSFASGRVEGLEYAGGLVGVNAGEGSTLRDSHASGTVVAQGWSGGLVGYNQGRIEKSHASGSVSGSRVLGGLAGLNEGVVEDSHATGAVRGAASVEEGATIGGLVGLNIGPGSIAGSHASGTVSGGRSVGGLVGRNAEGARISDSHASGAVSGLEKVGGLVGANQSFSSVTRSHASGSVSGRSQVGGLAGENTIQDVNHPAGLPAQPGGPTDSSITLSYATGSVSGTQDLGGLVGLNGQGGRVSDTYATGAVSGDPVAGGPAGGLVGRNADGASVSRSHASGRVSGAGPLGGLVGERDDGSPVADSYWDVERSGQRLSAGGTGLSPAQMTQAASFAGWDLATAGGSGAVWRIYEGRTAPLLRNFLKPLTVTVHDATRTYDGLPYSGGNGVSFSGVHDDSLLRGQGNYGGSAQGAREVGRHGLNSGLYSVQEGYDLLEVGGTLTIVPAVRAGQSLEATPAEGGRDGAAAPGADAPGLLAIVDGGLHLPPELAGQEP